MGDSKLHFKCFGIYGTSSVLRLFGSVALALSLGCSDTGKVDVADADVGTDVAVSDSDGDGFMGEDDCDESSPLVNAGAAELCDGLDNDCDGDVDEDVESFFYLDVDSDGFGDSGEGIEACDIPDGHSLIGGDCDDGRADVYPGAPELCDGLDNNCDGQTDENGVFTQYQDADGDGYGQTDLAMESCESLEGHVLESGDCDDGSGEAHPDAPEQCDGLDNDCDGEVDEGLGQTWYLDSDNDGFGDASNTTDACMVPVGHSEDGTDCDDSDSFIFPGAEEVCDYLDNDCDGDIDEGAGVGASVWFADADGDGYGDPSLSTESCSQPPGYVAVDTDCDDSSDSTHPGAAETESSSLCMSDSDGDGYGDSSPGFGVEPGGDCDDTAIGLNPAADEVCNGIDDNCDLSVDDAAAIDLSTWYLDSDGDGYGDPTNAVDACTSPPGHQANDADCDDGSGSTFPGAASEESATDCMSDDDGDGYGDSSPSPGVGSGSDCNDADASISPSATEVCNGVDDDCDASIDGVDAQDLLIWYLDSDGDGFGDSGHAVESCAQPSGTSVSDTDCDDGAEEVFPGADEYCNGIDDDCDGATDEDWAVDGEQWYLDSDGDGFGDVDVVLLACSQPPGHVSDDSDCDDGSSSTYPGAAPLDSVTECMSDLDGDERGDDAPGSSAVPGSDCSDSDPAVAPDALEICNGIDDNCDAAVDEIGAADGSSWYLDSDGDGFGDSDSTLLACSQPPGYASNAEDCDDGSSSAFPGAAPLDSATECMSDEDGDGYGDEHPSDGVSPGSDCDDQAPGLSPGEPEDCNGIDDDCDGQVDGPASTNPNLWFYDSDSDGYGDSGLPFYSCEQPVGYVESDQDCDDSSASVSPASDEYCNGSDDNCDGDVDEYGVLDGDLWFIDTDTDGYGDLDTLLLACSRPPGYVPNAEDCDDGSATAHPGVAPLDSATECMSDSDLDGYGDSDPASDAVPGTDCDDTSGAVSPLADERCNGFDDDCDGEVDELGAVDGAVWYLDSDSDGYGADESSLLACSQPPGYSAVGDDCDDGSSTTHPGAAFEESSSDCMGDGDGDGYGDETPGGDILPGSDCDDSSDAVSPVGVEVCNGLDDDCDGAADGPDASDPLAWYLDGDGDGFGDAASAVEACSQPDGYVSDLTDCDDASASAYPGAAFEESATDCMEDGDGDGFGEDSPGAPVQPGTDCDDGEVGVSPGAEEVCNGFDDNCDGSTDEDSSSDATSWYLDFDEDGFGDADIEVVSCGPPDGYVSDWTDCDDGEAGRSPGLAEDCDDGLDTDCDGSSDEEDSDCEAIEIEIADDLQNVDIDDLAGNPEEAELVRIYIQPGVTVGSSDPSIPAITTGDLPVGSVVELVNDGTIHGRGGNGACSYGGSGQNGGDAVLATVEMTIDNSNGAIYGAGGGGGSGDDPAGGGGGAGGGAGCDGGGNASGGTGGHGSQRFSSSPGGDGASYDGTAGTGGHAGSPSGAGAGGSGGSAGDGQDQHGRGQGGAGGGWGGGGGGGYYWGDNERNSGPGGTAGYAVRIQGGSLTWLGGNNVTQVKGLAE
jgi:large repetitive protein